MKAADALRDLDAWIEATLSPLDGVDSASRNPAGLNLPGILCQVTDLVVDTLSQDSWRVDLRVLLITSDLDVVDAGDSLARLVDVVRPALKNPPGSYTPTTYVSDQGSTFPALAFAYTLRAIPDETE